MTLTSNIPKDAAFPAIPESGRTLSARDSEEILLAGLCNGEDKAYEVLVRSFGPFVRAIAIRYLRSEADAADCFQDTFIAVFQNIRSFKRQSSFRQWVRGVTIKQCLMKLRKRQRQREDSIEHMLPMFDDRGVRVEVASPRQESGVGEELDAADLCKTVRNSIDKLPGDYRMVLLLRDIDGYTTRETATILGIQINAAKTRLHRARSALKFMLDPIMEQV